MTILWYNRDVFNATTCQLHGNDCKSCGNYICLSMGTTSLWYTLEIPVFCLVTSGTKIKTKIFPPTFSLCEGYSSGSLTLLCRAQYYSYPNPTG